METSASEGCCSRWLSCFGGGSKVDSQSEVELAATPLAAHQLLGTWDLSLEEWGETAPKTGRLRFFPRGGASQPKDVTGAIVLDDGTLVRGWTFSLESDKAGDWIRADLGVEGQLSAKIDIKNRSAQGTLKGKQSIQFWRKYADWDSNQPSGAFKVYLFSVVGTVMVETSRPEPDVVVEVDEDGRAALTYTNSGISYEDWSFTYVTPLCLESRDPRFGKFVLTWAPDCTIAFAVLNDVSKFEAIWPDPVLNGETW